MKLRFAAIFLSLFLSTQLFAQDFEGTVKYSITYEDLPAEMKGYEIMLPSLTTFFYKDNISKGVTNNPMSGGETIILTNNESGESLTLLDMMGKKYAISSGGNNDPDDINLTYKDTGEEKEIAGYKCKVASAQMNDNMVSVCYTQELPTIKSQNVNGIEGFPLEIMIEMEQMTTIQTATEIKKEEIDDIKFEAPKGYTKMTQQELKEKIGGMGM